MTADCIDISEKNGLGCEPRFGDARIKEVEKFNYLESFVTKGVKWNTKKNKGALENPKNSARN